MQLLLVLSILVATAFADSSYVVLVPSTIRSNMDLTISVDIVSASSPVKVTAELKKYVAVLDTDTVIFQPGVPGSITLRVPNGISGAGYTLAVRGTGGLQFSESTSLQVSQKEISVFIQTDKAIYRPGDTVQFRTFAIYADLKPYGGTMDILIQDAENNKILQMLNVQPDEGVITKDLPLSTQPVFGVWKISVSALGETGTKEFHVDEYVLPKFEVDISLPPYVIVTDDNIVFKVKATYTYGKPVSGTVDGQVKLVDNNNRDNPLVNVAVHVPIDGEAEITVSSLAKELSALGGNARRHSILVTAVVAESISNNTVTQEEVVDIFDQAVVIEFARSNPTRFKPGLQYIAYLKVTRPDGRPVGKISDRARVTFAVTPSGSLPEQQQTIPENGLVSIRVNTPANAQNIAIRFTLHGQSKVLSIRRSESSSNSYLQLSGLQRNTALVFMARSNKPMQVLVYQIVSRGIIVKTGHVNAQGRTSQLLQVVKDSSMAPSARIIAYYVTDTGEIVTDSISFDVDGIFENEVSVTASKNQAEPNDQISVTVQADPNSVAHLLAIDQSVLILRTGNDVTASDVHEQIKLFDTTTDPNNDIWPIGVLSWPFPIFYGERNAKEMFQAAGIRVITDAQEYVTKFELRKDSDGSPKFIFPCQGGPCDDLSPPVQPAARPLPPQPQPQPALQEPARVRFHFPETWLWKQLPIGSSGSASVAATVPDTITSWVISAFAVNSASGLGVASTTQMTVFLPFFVSLNLPYSIIRGEQLAVQALVFNHLEQDLLVTVTFQNSDKFIIPHRENGVDTTLQTDAVKTVVVAKGSVNSVNFPIIPLGIGKVDIEVKAQSSVAADAVRRQLLVEADGMPAEENIPVVIDLTNGLNSFMKTVPISLPDRAIEDSKLIRITATGELLGSTIAGLEKLLRQPTGCGEQTMIKMAPNVYITSYLTTFGLLTNDIRQKALKFMTDGYQNELRYRRKDGSFSVWGNRDPKGSVWLSAFVALVFHQARAYIYVDDKVIIDAVNWIVNTQNNDGSFSEVGRVIHREMQGQAGQGAPLTAFVLISLLENRNLANQQTRQIWNTGIVKAVKYIERTALTSTNTYHLALYAYALQLAGSSKVDEVLARVEQDATVQDGLKFWRLSPSSGRIRAIDVETTAYLLLTYASRHDIQSGLSTMAWIIQQRNSRGGFYSTQDTVVALHALTEFAKLTQHNVQMQIETKLDASPTYSFSVDESNAMVLQTRESKTVPSEVKITAQGSGVALVEIGLFYHLLPERAREAFELTATVLDETFFSIKVRVCSKWLESDPTSGMAVGEIGIPSGYDVVQESLTKLAILRRAEYPDRRMVLYFDEIGKSPVCVEFSLTLTGIVTMSAPALVQCYDYYRPHYKATTTYQSQLYADMGILDACPDC